ncbi:hypothetical protein AMEJIAPC_00572 [Caulobacter sp. NIBR1757]|nr:hypothetical protein AMEJIAPC_00572 [Caulobacter sp. NIBR1757]
MIGKAAEAPQPRPEQRPAAPEAPSAPPRKFEPDLVAPDPAATENHVAPRATLDLQRDRPPNGGKPQPTAEEPRASEPLARAASGDPSPEAQPGRETKVEKNASAIIGGLDDIVANLLRSPKRTFAVIGDYTVGKTFFIKKATAIAEQKGFFHEEIDADIGYEAGPTMVSASIKRENSAREAEEILATQSIKIHDFTGPKGQFRIIDLPGEFFDAAMKLQGGLSAVHNDRVQKIYPALAVSSGVILVVPAPDVFPKPEFDASPQPMTDGVPKQQLADQKAERAAGLMNQVRTVCNLVQAKEDAGTIKDILAAIFAMSRQERAEWTGANQAASPKPAMILLSKADNCFGLGKAARLRPAPGVWPREDDPMGSVVQTTARGLVNGLVNGFSRCRVDYLTSAEGCTAENKMLDGSEPCLGVWSAVEWMLKQIDTPLSGERPRWFSRQGLENLLRHGHLAPDDAKLTGWVVDMRKRGDSDFKYNLDAVG